MLKVLFIGGTGNISTAVSQLALKMGIDLYLLNRGKMVNEGLQGAKYIMADINNMAPSEIALQGHYWDTVVNWIAFTPDQICAIMSYLKAKPVSIFLLVRLQPIKNHC
jgi:nucleoside-diphosphate-sugar epimerase